MRIDHENRVVVVTGAGRGLSRADAMRMASHGARVACVDIDVAAADSTAELIRADGGVAVALEVDVRDHEQVASAHQAIRGQLGPIAILHNVAGFVERAMLLDGDPTHFAPVLAVNLGGAYNCMRTFAPDMLDADWVASSIFLRSPGWSGTHTPPTERPRGAHRPVEVGTPRLLPHGRDLLRGLSRSNGHAESPKGDDRCDDDEDANRASAIAR